MALITPFILTELPTQLTPSAIYFISHPLDETQLRIYVANTAGTSTKCVYTTSPIANMQPAIFDSTSVEYTDGNVSKKKFYLTQTEIAYVTYQYTSGNLTSKKLYIGNVFMGKVTYTYTSGVFTSSQYSTVE